MSLAEALARPESQDDATCAVADLLASLNDRDAAALRSALEPGAMDSGDLQRILRREGHALTQDAIRRHKVTIGRARGVLRRGLGCSCPSPTN